MKRPKDGGNLKYLSILFLLIACPVHAETFKVVVYGDTHDWRDGAPIINGYNDWIIANHDALNIEYVLHLGDLVQVPSDLGVTATSMHLLDGEVPYLISIGNHDYDGWYTLPSSGWTTGSFTTAFPVATFEDWVGDKHYSTNMLNAYDTITVDGESYLFMALEYCPSDAVIAWADGILSANTDKHVIIAIHYYFETFGTAGIRATNDDDYSGGVCTNNGSGKALYQNVFKNYPNIMMILSGHGWDLTSKYLDGTITKVDVISGSNINQIRENWQADTRGNLYLRIYTIDTGTDVIRVQSYSPSTDTYLLNSEDNFYLNRTSYRLENVTCEGIIIQ